MSKIRCYTFAYATFARCTRVVTHAMAGESVNRGSNDTPRNAPCARVTSSFAITSLNYGRAAAIGPRWDHSVPSKHIKGVNTSCIPDASHSLYGLLSPPRFRPLTPRDTSTRWRWRTRNKARGKKKEEETASEPAPIPRRENYFSQKSRRRVGVRQ